MAAPRRCMLVLVAIGFAFGLSGCASGELELDPAYWFPDGKKKLPGDRREVFPGGVPGVTQGVPPELIRGNPDNPTNLPEQALAPAQAPQQQPEAQEKPRPRPKKVARPRPTPPPEPEAEAQPAPRTAAPRPAQPPQQQQPAGAWPAPQAQQQQPQQQQAPAAGAWPAPPASGTFTR
jgi:hypothetical protein